MSTESKKVAINKWYAALQGQSEALAQKYSGPVTGAELYKDADRWWQIATKFNEASEDFSSATADDLKQAERNMLALLEFRPYAKRLPKEVLISRQDAERAYTLFSAPIAWLQKVGSTILHRSVKLTEFIDDVKNAPSNAIKWTLDQLFKSLGLPTWFGTAIAVTATVGLGWWGYQTFLRPAMMTSRALTPRYRNPAGRRRRRRRRLLVAA